MHLKLLNTPLLLKIARRSGGSTHRVAASLQSLCILKNSVIL